MSDLTGKMARLGIGAEFSGLFSDVVSVFAAGSTLIVSLLWGVILGLIRERDASS